MPGILLAEDNPADVYLIREALKEHGVDCPIQTASDGRDVLALIDSAGPSWHPDLIILDLNLPRHDGIELLRKLRSTAELSRVPVVVLTSSDSPRDRATATELGATRYLSKPSNLEHFLELGAIFRELLMHPGQTPSDATPEEPTHEA
jgi:two-component system, chemotaxis family, response regulator Rcp1